MHAADLSSVFYVSRARANSAQVEGIVGHSRRNNLARGMTGGMFYTGNYFAQVLEGPAETVVRTLAAIRADDRHEGMRILAEGPQAVRRFAVWTMGFVVLPFADQIILPLMAGPIDADAARNLGEMLLTVISRDQGHGVG